VHPSYAANYDFVQKIQYGSSSNPRGSSVGIRYGGVQTGPGYGTYNGHGRLGSINGNLNIGSPVTPGMAIMKMGDTGTSAGNGHLHFEIRYMIDVQNWTSPFNGYCGKHYINKIMQDAAPFPYTIAWTNQYGGLNSCLGVTS